MADSQSYPKAYRIRATPGLLAQYKARGLHNTPIVKAAGYDTLAVNLKVTRDELLELIKDAVEQRDLNRGSIKRVYSYFLGHLRSVQREAAKVRVSEPTHYSRSVCGLPRATVDAWEAAGREGELRIEPLTTSIKHVTCKECRRIIVSITKEWEG